MRHFRLSFAIILKSITMFSNEYTFKYLLGDEQLLYPFEYLYDMCLEANLSLDTEDWLNKANEFCEKSWTEFYGSCVNNVILGMKNSTLDVEEIIKSWEKVFKEEIFEYSDRRCATDEELFAMAYHKLVHSPVLETMLKLEHNYTKEVVERIRTRNRQEQTLKDSQTEEMRRAVDNLNITTNEKMINNLVSKHFEDLSFLQGKWSSELDTMKEVQRREYRKWIMQILEDNQTNNSLPTPSNSPHNISENIFKNNRHQPNEKYLEIPKYEESFTIHLGSQIKQMHNIRIMASNVMDSCSISKTIESRSEPAPDCLQTALGLYSNDICGLVLMTDSHVDIYSKMLKGFTQVCQCSTEFHFTHFEEQLDKINNAIKISLSLGLRQRLAISSEGASGTGFSSKYNKHLQSGDVYITRHSNLAQVHVVFHIVSDDTVTLKEINSRHPVLLGLRNIMKIACCNDVTSLTIPLLLQHNMTEEMTISWCAKRAELVFKCVKGFMIEMASCGGSDLKNLQFLLPQNISNSVFQSLAGMLPNIFKLSNPLVLRASTMQKN